MKARLKLVGFEYTDAETVDEISRNISVLIATPEGTCAGDRGYGIDQSFVDMPYPQALNMLMLTLAEKVPEYEPRAVVDTVEAETGNDGTMTAVIYIEPAEGREET